ncbi:zinc finger protein [Cinnamomum micranthum f. kanehirae]|uniref:Protein transport protein SEC23 n=1 Tax=Cinnamomum micranthum f. kanehirae TaxID=337451 RepID=A0A3S4P937_9MAGN|nr:zinc finger protein [Cinnamomum micranthum f. kanehirae]
MGLPLICASTAIPRMLASILSPPPPPPPPPNSSPRGPNISRHLDSSFKLIRNSERDEEEEEEEETKAQIRLKKQKTQKRKKEMSEFADLESQDGVRMPWNVFPGSKQESTSIVVPVSAIYTPLKPFSPSANLPLLSYSPLRCLTCRSLLNPFSTVDLLAKIWICPFCFHRNHFPPHCSSISDENLLAELFPQYTTIEYQIDLRPAPPPPPSVFLFVVDTCVIDEELGFLKSAIARALDLVPEASLIGLITFGTFVQVHELGYGQIPKCFVFKGSKEVAMDQMLEQMNFFMKKAKGVKPVTGAGYAGENMAIFLLPASECEFVLNSVLEELQKDPWAVPANQCAVRCTGTALSVAACLLGACVPGSGARIMAFVGGPSTEGAGAIVSKDSSEHIRSHKDLDKDSAPHFHKAIRFYEGLAKQLVNQWHVGIAEIKVAVERTGGLVVLAESFGHSVFKDSLKRVFQSADSDLGLSYNWHTDIHLLVIIEQKGPICSETVIDQGNTSAWKMCGLAKATSLCLMFDILKKDIPDAIGQPASNHYQHSDGHMRFRASTLSRRWVAGPGMAGFDQEAAAAVMARFVSFKMEDETEFGPIRWLDRSLIRICSRFGDYQRDSPSSFSLSPRFSIFPQFMFHLRRSQFVQVFNNSPDETAFYRMILNRGNVAN